MPDRPNVILFTVDQLSARWIEDQTCPVPTPNLERLRNEGVTFPNTFSSNPVCAPARATLATGLTSRQHGVLQNGYRLDPTLPTVMDRLQASGYRTGGFGKFHFVPQYAGPYPDYERYGFDVTHITEDSRIGAWLDWVESVHPDQYEAALATVWQTDIPGLDHYGDQDRDLRKEIESAQAGFDWGDEAFAQDSPAAYTLPFPAAVSQTNWITDRGLDFLRSSDNDRSRRDPFFAHFSYVQPHAPACPPAEYLSAVETAEIPDPIPPEWPDDPDAPACFRSGDPARHSHLDLPAHWRRHREYYFADIAHLDAQLGRVLDAIADRGGLEETVVIFLSDHGDLLYDHGFTGKGQKHYDGAIRVPLTIAGPGLETGIERPELVQLEDIVPTILELTGTDPPGRTTVSPFLDEDAVPSPLPGVSLGPLCRGESPDWRAYAYIESYNNVYSTAPTHWARTIRSVDYRYTYYPQDSGEQLFHLASDPNEQTNLASDPAAREVKHRLRQRLLDQVILQDYPHPDRGLQWLGVP